MWFATGEKRSVGDLDWVLSEVKARFRSCFKYEYLWFDDFFNCFGDGTGISGFAIMAGLEDREGSEGRVDCTGFDGASGIKAFVNWILGNFI